MADQKLTDLTAVTTAADTDIVYLVVNPGSSPAGRKMSINDVLRRGHGSISVTAGAGSQVLAGTGPELMTQFTVNSGASVNCTPDHTLDEIVVDAVGTWAASLFLSFTGTASAAYDIHIYYNGSSVATVSKALDGSNTEDSVTITVEDIAVASATTDFECFVEGGTDTFAVKEGRLSISRRA